MDYRKKNLKRLLIPLLLSFLVAFAIVIPAAGMLQLENSGSSLRSAAATEALAPEFMPPRPGLFNFRPTGKSGSLAPTPGLSTLFRENTVPAQRASVPTTGEARILAVLVQFSDVKFTAPYDTSLYWNWLFDPTPVSNSLYNYYREVSYGKLSLNGGPSIPPIVTVSKTMADYGADSPYEIDAANGPIYRLAQDALAALSTQGFDFSPYDFNPKDGVIDHLLIIHAGSGQESTGTPNDIWSHRWAIPGGQPLTGGISAFGYTMQPENGELGVFAHEFGHDLGLPDLYDRDNDSMGLGRWSLMASGSWNGTPPGATPAHMSAWEKMQLGWLTPQTITKQEFNIPTVSGPDNTSAVIYRLPTESSYEYFLIENRQQVGYDFALPGSGLLIYHVDESVPNNDNQQHYKVALEQADNLHQLEQIPYPGSDGDGGDPYPGSSNNRSFTETSSPNNRSYQGKPSTVALAYIDNSGSTMTIKAVLTITATGGIVEDISGAKVEIPANAVLRDTVVRITEVAPAKVPPMPPDKVLPSQKVWEFEPDGTRFSKPVKITLPYPDPSGTSIDPTKLRIFYWDPYEVAWLPVGGKVDTANKTVTAEVNHFSMYTVMESTLPLSISGNLISYLALTNNPFTPNGDGKKDNTIFKFTLARDARVNIRVYDSQGNLVVPLVEGINQLAGQGTIVWDGTNNAGQTVGSGIYVFKIEATDGQGHTQTLTKPVAVVRPR